MRCSVPAVAYFRELAACGARQDRARTGHGASTPAAAGLVGGKLRRDRGDDDAFIAYQLYRITAVRFSAGRTALTVLDIALVWLSWREHRSKRTPRRLASYWSRRRIPKGVGPLAGAGREGRGQMSMGVGVAGTDRVYRAAAVVALGSAVAALVVMCAAVRVHPWSMLGIVVALPAAVIAGWHVVTRRGLARWWPA